ncbi:M20 metallopeptidase family protein [Clostridium thermopalmarium]|uniref:Putative hydrolase YxeP n=1 Tax=Clostridium thermopalmarium DSM 5974 TaxID=1121340 RepID=A0A2T0ALF1_9CLOT|nr:M20 family metallopeptidase [Clostridium thermopalmarium]MBE6044454.1 amidohydrolase [Clostridium thermopalmarium]PRR69438.1 putative hydrolase YxeP [Clostridium thermopalmarium DSM 5974]PVZ26296.1 amidohydrolase [Clostridium thermopalmarium DSM 5974]
MDFLKEAKEISEELVSIRRDFHQNPETDFDLNRTVSKVKEFLEKEGIEYIETSKNGICGIIRGNGEKTIGIRADMDALPMEDKKSCVYSSKVEGKMHACGHDVHTTILLGAGKILNKMRNKLNGNVKLIFEPAEETTGGAIHMIKEGILENPKVDAIIGLHVEPNIEVGKIGIKRDVVNAASNPFKIRIMGKGGHGAYPHSTVDPIVISANVITALQDIVSREIPPTDSAVITIGSIHGGTAQNIIPDEVEISGIIRTMTTEHRAYVKKRMIEVVEGITKAMRGRCEVEIEESYPCLYNEDSVVDVLKAAAEDVITRENVIMLQKPVMGVESFAYFSMERPSAFYYLGIRNEERGIVHPLHSNLFDVDEECIKVGVAIHCQTALRYLNEKKK